MTATLQVGMAMMVTFAVSCAFIHLAAAPARRIGLLDHPDRRKRHDVSTPMTGGLGLAAGFTAGLFIVDIDLAPYWTLLVGMLALLVAGLVDDLNELSPSARLLIQIGIGGLMVYGGGIEVRVLGEIIGPAAGPIGLGPLAGPLTILCVVFMINAINMSDGLDGLAGGIALLILALLAVLAWMGDLSSGLVLLPLLLALATLGFLVHNLRTPGNRQARAFLGDTGSMVLGFAIAWLAIAIGTDPAADIPPISIAWILIIPGMDTLAVFFRRIRLGRSPFAPDRAHLHHILRRCGFSVSRSVHVIHLLVVVTGLFGILISQYALPEWLMFGLAAGVMLGYQVLLANAYRLVRWCQRRRRG